MSASKSESADTADTDDGSTDDASEDEFTYYPQVTQHPTTIIEGDIVDIVTGADIDSDVEDTGTPFGVVFEDPTVEAGSLWQNDSIPEGFASSAEFNDLLRVAINGSDMDYVRGREVTDDLIAEAREQVADVLGISADETEDLDYDDNKVSGTDFKVADESDAEVQYDQNGDEKGIDVGGGTFNANAVDAFDTERIMVWYSGMAGQFVGRALDFNGMPFARYTEPDDGDLPYLVKGLFQAPIGWRGDADIEQFGDVPTTDRSKLARSEDNGGLGRPPRVARPPVLRDDMDGRTFIAIGRYDGGRMHEVHVGRALDDYTDFEAELRKDDGDTDDEYDGYDMKYDQSAEDTLNAEFDNPAEVFALHHGEGWQDEPEETDDWAEGSGDSGGSFDTPDVEVDGDEVDHPTEQEVEFAEGISEKLAGTGVNPDDQAVFPTEDGNVDLAGIIEHNSDEFNVTPDTDAIRRVVYENTSHLSAGDL